VVSVDDSSVLSDSWLSVYSVILLSAVLVELDIRQLTNTSLYGTLYSISLTTLSFKDELSEYYHNKCSSS